jgi:hypothetical protein
MQIRNLKRDINDVDPVDEASFGAMGAAAALFARNPAFITKQAFPCIFLPPLPPPPHHNCNNPVFPLQFPALYVSILNQYPMPVKSITTGITCAPPPSPQFPPAMFSGVTRCFRYAVGDLIAQSFETDDGTDPSAPKKGYNWERAAVFMAFGTFLAGPVYAMLPPAAAAASQGQALLLTRSRADTRFGSTKSTGCRTSRPSLTVFL